MGQRWAWMGVVGVCALLTGCRARESHERSVPVVAQAPAAARPSESTSQELMSRAPPVQTVAQQSTIPAQVTPTPAPPSTSVPSRTPSANTVAQPTPSAARGGTTVTESGATQQAPEGRVMIGLEAVQAREDESWYEGAAKAARAAHQSDSVPLAHVVIATGTVDGRVARVDRGTLHVRDGEGNVYQLRIDKRSRGLRQGQNVPLRQLEEGTPVRAEFDLVGGTSIARDIEIRR